VLLLLLLICCAVSSVMGSMSGWASSLRQATEKVTTAIQNAPKNNPSGSGGGGGFSFGRAASFLQATEKMVNSLAQNTAQATRDVVSSISAQNPTAAEYLRPVTQSQVFKRSESPTAPATIIAASTPPASTTSVTSTTHATAHASPSPLLPGSNESTPSRSLIDFGDAASSVSSAYQPPAPAPYIPGPPLNFQELHSSYGLEMQAKTSGTVRPSTTIVDESLLDLLTLKTPEPTTNPIAHDDSFLLTCSPSLISFEPLSPTSAPSATGSTGALLSFAPSASPVSAAYSPSVLANGSPFTVPSTFNVPPTSPLQGQYQAQNQQARQQGNNDLLSDLSC
jgi:hypothetical protein